METTWEFDAPDGVYKNHAMSGKLLEVAALQMRMVPFTQKEKDFGKRKGKTLTLYHYKPLTVPTTAQLDERTRIPIDKMEMDGRIITVSEWGRGVEVTNLNQQLSKWDPLERAQKLLVSQMKECMDNAAAVGFKGAKVKFIPTSLTGGTWDVDGTPSTTALENLTVAHLEVIRDYMANDLHVPFYDGNTYAGLFTTRALRGIKSDRRFEHWKQYLRDGDVIYNSEVGQVEQVRCVEINQEGALSNSKASGVLGEGLVLGDEAVSRVEAEYPHLRYDPNYQGDFGRRKAAAWYGIVAFATTWDSANDREAKIVHITSQ